MRPLRRAGGSSARGPHRSSRCRDVNDRSSSSTPAAPSPTSSLTSAVVHVRLAVMQIFVKVRCRRGLCLSRLGAAAAIADVWFLFGEWPRRLRRRWSLLRDVILFPQPVLAAAAATLCLHWRCGCRWRGRLSQWPRLHSSSRCGLLRRAVWVSGLWGAIGWNCGWSSLLMVCVSV